MFFTVAWDRIAFHKEKKASETLELIGKALPIIDTINKMQDDNKLDSHSAEKLKRNILSGLNNFVSSGIMLPEFNDFHKPEPKIILSPEPKLLNQAIEESQTQPNNPSNTEPISEEDEISDEELKEAIKKIKHRRKK